eukprot:361012-Chlamydomonas_euryale.AAC.3
MTRRPSRTGISTPSIHWDMHNRSDQTDVILLAGHSSGVVFQEFRSSCPTAQVVKTENVNPQNLIVSLRASTRCLPTTLPFPFRCPPCFAFRSRTPGLQVWIAHTSLPASEIHRRPPPFSPACARPAHHVLLLVVRHQVRKREAVVRDDEVDRGRGAAVAAPLATAVVAPPARRGCVCVCKVWQGGGVQKAKRRAAVAAPLAATVFAPPARRKRGGKDRKVWQGGGVQKAKQRGGDKCAGDKGGEADVWR